MREKWTVGLSSLLHLLKELKFSGQCKGVLIFFNGFAMYFFLVSMLIPFFVFSSGIEDAKTYHNNSQLQWGVALKTIENVSWKETERVLDVGCGDGKITAFLAEKIPHGSILGIDISQSMIDFASAQYSNLVFEKQDAAEIVFEEQFDRIVSFSTLHWVLNQEQALKAMYRALIPGGSICLHTYGKGVMNVTEIANDLIYTEKWASHFPLYTKQRVFFNEEEYRELLERAGFQQIEIVGTWNEVVFSDRQALTAFAKPLLNFIRHLSADLQHEFAEEVLDQIILIAQPTDGQIPYRTYNLHVLGKKY